MTILDTAELKREPVYPTAEELTWLARSSRTPRLRTMAQFAEEEIVIPEGPSVDKRYRIERQPLSGLWFAAVDSGNWTRFAALGPRQSTKTLSCSIVPLMYHLFEVGETVVFGLPDMDMAADKWRMDIEPVIARSRYRDLLPVKGPGSRGGKVRAVQFRNGRTLKFMSGGGGDKSRAGYTSRVMVLTEVDGMDEAGARSRETDKITQFEACQSAFRTETRRTYMECTVSVEVGRIWQEYTKGTASRIVLPCPHCAAWVNPEREQLVGWQEATNVIEARTASHFCCPGCGAAWTEEERIAANQSGRLLHKGQQMGSDGRVIGEPPVTDTLGFRWTPVNNLFVSPGDYGVKEWKAARSPDEENSEKEMRQFVWALPYQPPRLDSTPLEYGAVAARTNNLPRGEMPPDVEWVTSHIDLGKYLCHWMVVAWRMNATGLIVDYGRVEVASQELGVERALLAALRQFRDLIRAGWIQRGKEQPRTPDLVRVDAKWMPDPVFAFCGESIGPGLTRFEPAQGYGTGQQGSEKYFSPRSINAAVRKIGDHWHVVRDRQRKTNVAHVDADFWKSWAQQRLFCPVDAPGAMTLFRALPHDHLAMGKHLTSEKEIEEFVAGRGMVRKFVVVRHDNHWLDCLYNCAAAANSLGTRLIETTRPGDVAGPVAPTHWFAARKKR